MLLDGRSIHESSAKSVARRLGMLHQSPAAPESFTVLDLVGRGRYPHQSLFRQWSDAVQQAVVAAMGLLGDRRSGHRHAAGRCRSGQRLMGCRMPIVTGQRRQDAAHAGCLLVPALPLEYARQ